MDRINPLYAAPRGDDDPDDESGARDRQFNAYRYASSPEAQKVVREAIDLVLSYEAHFKLKKNKRRAADQSVFDLTVDAVLSDLMRHEALSYPKGIYLSRSNKVLGTKSRYRPQVYSKQFPYILDLLAKPEMGYIRQEVAEAAQGHPTSTVIKPGDRLLDRVVEHDIDETDLDEHPHSEVIILKRAKDADDFWDEGGLAEYGDDEVTYRYRAELEEINRWLSAADLRFDHLGIEPPHTPFDIRARRLRRIFTRGRFDSGGRLFGGFWQELRKAERRRGLWIEGERAVELDYGQAGARILYGMAGEVPPVGDLYAVYGYLQHRAGIKRVMSAMTFATSRLDRFPQETKRLFRPKDKMVEVVAEIERKHAQIEDHFFRGLGHDAQFIESQVLLEVIKTLNAEDIVALPIHDAIMVPASRVDRSREVMLDVFHRISGVKGLVTEERE